MLVLHNHHIHVGLLIYASHTIQFAVASFLREGHYLRHLRRMKRVYAGRREALLRCLREAAVDALEVQATAGMAVVTRIRAGAPDTDIALRALPFGMAPAPLSPRYAHSPQPRGFLLGVTNVDERRLVADCRRLADLVRQARSPSGNIRNGRTRRPAGPVFAALASAFGQLLRLR